MPSFSTTPSGRLRDADVPADQRTYATFTHFVPLVINALLIGFTGLSPIASLIMWRIRGKDSPFLNDHGKEALNFQISLLLLSLIGWILTSLLIGFVLLFFLYILGVYAGIRASMAAHRAEYYRYPMTLRLIA